MGKHTRAPKRPLLLTDNEEFLEDVLTLSAAAKVDVEVAPDIATARRHWLAASMVIVDESVVQPDSRWTLDRRADVVVIGRDLDDGSVWQRALRIGAEHVVFLPEAREWLARKLATPIRSKSADVIGVFGGCGGAGASTYASALALHAAADERDVVLIDADVVGGGIDMLLGSETQAGMRWDGLVEASGTIDRALLVEALPTMQGVSVLSFSARWTQPPNTEVVAEVLSALADGGDLIVVDLGRYDDSFVEPVAEGAGKLLVVVPARVRAVAAAQARLGAIEHLRDRIQVVVRQPAPSGLDPDEIASALDLPLLGTIANDSRRAEWEEHGIAPDSRAAWSSVCRAALLSSGRLQQAA